MSGRISCQNQSRSTVDVACLLVYDYLDLSERVLFILWEQILYHMKRVFCAALLLIATGLHAT